MDENEIREKMAAIHAEATKLTNVAKSEDRDLTEEEGTQFDALMAKYNSLKEKDLPRAQWQEQQAGYLAAKPASDPPVEIMEPDQPEKPRASKITIPARARTVRQLKAFKGPEAEREAYLSGNFIAAVLGYEKAQDWCRANGVPVVRDALSGNVNTKGGYLVPEEFERSVINLQEEYGVFRRKAYRSVMTSDTKTQPRRVSGPTVYFVGENTEITASDPVWDAVNLTAHKIAVLTKMSSELSEDAFISMADSLADEFARAFARTEDDCGFLGDGTSTYGGMQGLITACTTATATTVTAATANTAFSTLDLLDFENMIGKLPEFPGISPEWYIHKTAWAASMMRLADAAGGNTADILEGRRSMSFLGYPVNFVQNMNSTTTAQTSTKGLCYFGDLSMAATFGDRRGMTMAVSEDRYFEYDQIGVKATERFDVNVHDVGDTSVAGAIIMLATPAS